MSLMHERATRRVREVNWGDRTRLRGPEPKTLAWVSSDVSGAVVVYATARVESPGVVCVVNVEWGHGGASVEHDFPVVHRLRVPLAASMIKLTGRLVDSNGQPARADARGSISAVVAPGQDGETLRNTRWVAQSGSDGVMSDKPERVMQVEGVNAGGAKTWLMLFDGPARTGAAPAIVMPVDSGQRFAVSRRDSQAFGSMVAWGASSAPLKYAKDPNASLRVDAEFLL